MTTCSVNVNTLQGDSVDLGAGVCQHVGPDPDELRAQARHPQLGVADQELHLRPLGDPVLGAHVQLALHAVNELEDGVQFAGTDQAGVSVRFVFSPLGDEHGQPHEAAPLPGHHHQGLLLFQVPADHGVEVGDPVARLHQRDGDVHGFVRQEVEVEELNDLVMVSRTSHLE